MENMNLIICKGWAVWIFNTVAEFHVMSFYGGNGQFYIVLIHFFEQQEKEKWLRVLPIDIELLLSAGHFMFGSDLKLYWESEFIHVLLKA